MCVNSTPVPEHFYLSLHPLTNMQNQPQINPYRRGGEGGIFCGSKPTLNCVVL